MRCILQPRLKLLFAQGLCDILGQLLRSFPLGFAVRLCCLWCFRRRLLDGHNGLGTPCSNANTFRPRWACQIGAAMLLACEGRIRCSDGARGDASIGYLFSRIKTTSKWCMACHCQFVCSLALFQHSSTPTCLGSPRRGWKCTGAVPFRCNQMTAPLDLSCDQNVPPVAIHPMLHLAIRAHRKVRKRI